MMQILHHPISPNIYYTSMFPMVFAIFLQSLAGFLPSTVLPASGTLDQWLNSESRRNVEGESDISRDPPTAPKIGSDITKHWCLCILLLYSRTVFKNMMNNILEWFLTNTGVVHNANCNGIEVTTWL